MLSKQPITSLITSLNTPQISHKKIGLYDEIPDNVICLHASYKATANLSVAGPLGHGWGVLVFAVFSVICCSLRLVYIHVRFITFLFLVFVCYAGKQLTTYLFGSRYPYIVHFSKTCTAEETFWWNYFRMKERWWVTTPPMSACQTLGVCTALNQPLGM